MIATTSASSVRRVDDALHVVALDGRPDVQVADLRDREAVQRRRQAGDRQRDLADGGGAPRAVEAQRRARQRQQRHGQCTVLRQRRQRERQRQQQHDVAQHGQHEQQRKRAERRHADPGPAVGDIAGARPAPAEGARDQQQRSQQQQAVRGRQPHRGQLRRNAPADVQVQQPQDRDGRHSASDGAVVVRFKVQAARAPAARALRHRAQRCRGSSARRPAPAPRQRARAPGSRRCRCAAPAAVAGATLHRHAPGGRLLRAWRRARRRPATSPASTSPEPEVARPGGAAVVAPQPRRPGAAIQVVGALQRHHRVPGLRGAAAPPRAGRRRSRPWSGRSGAPSRRRAA